MEQARHAAVWLGALDAQERVLACVREAFGLEAFDPSTGNGVLEDDCMLVLAQFDEWLEKNVSPAAN